MSLPNELLPVGLLGTGDAGGYQIERSLRFNSSDSAYLSRTPASAGNRKTWTWAGWVKRSAIGVAQNFFSVEQANTDTGRLLFYFNSDDKFSIDGATVNFRVTTQVFRDPSAWLHVLVGVNTTLSTANDRIRVYINGLQVSTFSTINNPGQSSDTGVNSASAHNIGRFVGGSTYFSGYLADIHFIDGQALDPTSFGEFDTNGVWQPIEYQGEYGTNGFHLPFSDNSTAAALGTDTSGNGNDWTPNNLSVTAGAGNDSLVDTPTSGSQVDTGLGGQVTGNYATGNLLFSVNASFRTLANGNLDWSYTNGSNTAVIPATVFPASGKWYAEFAFTSFATGGRIGIVNTNCTDVYVGQTTTGVGYENTGQVRYNGGVTSYGASWTANDLIGVALDLDNGTVSFYKNGASQGVARSGLTGSWTFGVDAFSGTCIANFGQRQWAYAAPSGFRPLVDTLLPAPVVAKPNSVFDVALWTGNGSARSITGLNFNPDFVWIKGRSGATDHALYDLVRGAEKRLESNTTDAEVTSDGGVTAFNSDGFSLGTLAQVNTNSSTYVGWAWDAGSSTVTNTDGSITSQVRANPSAGFSVVTYTGTGAAGSFGHGLNTQPGLVLIKSRTLDDNWIVYHSSRGNTEGAVLNNSNAFYANVGFWNNTSPTSAVFTVGAYGSPVSQAMVAYCFAPVAGYSSFGSYTGNGSADGPFVYTGFRPRWVMIKRTDTTGSWVMLDAARDPTNVVSPYLLAESADAENSAGAFDWLDFTSNGFKHRNTGVWHNASGGTYIYAAFAESPFQYARAR